MILNNPEKYVIYIVKVVNMIGLRNAIETLKLLSPSTYGLVEFYYPN